MRSAPVVALVVAALAALAPPARAGSATALPDPAAAASPVTATRRDTVLGRQIAARADAPAVAAVTSVRGHYVLHCAGCHGLDGAGSTIGRVPDMRRLGDWLRVPGGRAFVISVPGVMGSGLSDAEVAAVTNWVLGHLSQVPLPADHHPYDAGEVAQARAKPLADVAAERRRLVSRAHALGISID